MSLLLLLCLKILREFGMKRKNISSKMWLRYERDPIHPIGSISSRTDKIEREREKFRSFDRKPETFKEISSNILIDLFVSSLEKGKGSTIQRLSRRTRMIAIYRETEVQIKLWNGNSFKSLENLPLQKDTESLNFWLFKQVSSWERKGILQLEADQIREENSHRHSHRIKVRIDSKSIKDR